MKIFQKMTALFCLFFAISAVPAFAAIDALNFDDAAQEQNYHMLTQQLRCPQCQNNSIADSNAAVAVDMRGKVLDLLKQGKSKEDVVNYMVERYGNFVTYDPPLTVSTLVLWLAPLLLVLCGLAVVFKGKSGPTDEQSAVGITEVSAEQLSAEQQIRLNEILNREQKK